jgi:O-antigen ligase
MNIITKYLSSFFILLFFSLSLIAPSGYSYGAAALTLSGLTLLLLQKAKPPLSKEIKIIAILFIFYFLVFAAETVIYKDPVSNIDRPIKFILALFALYFLIAKPPLAEFFWAGISIGAMGSGLLALWQSLALNTTRVEGFSMAIQYGNIAILYGAMCLFGITWSQRKENKKIWTAVLLLGFIFGLTGSFLSGSRGGWLIIPFIFIYFIYINRDKIKPVIGFITLASVLIISYNIPGVSSNVKNRFNDIFNDLSEYKKGNASTSIGIRIELIKGSLILIKEKPILGHGTQGYEAGLVRLTDNGVINLALISHAHNDILDAWAKRGILGFTTLLAIYLIPLIIIIKKIRTADNSEKSVLATGIVFISSCVIFGLTQAFLMHNSGSMIYAFGLVIIMSLIYSLKKQE